LDGLDGLDGLDASEQSNRNPDSAMKQPDRVCVVETASSECPKRNFISQHLFAGSNDLVCYLGDAGITNDNVAML
jgi:L-aminoadipate-semialdehyde dehydrogenase